MLTFKTPLDCRALEDGENWELLKDLVVDVGKIDGKDLIKIPKGFVTDFGSVPAPFSWFINKEGKAKPAFVLHDYLYRTQDRSQLVADAILNEAMEGLGVNWFQRFCIYRGLRIGGWVTYDQYTKVLNQK